MFTSKLNSEKLDQLSFIEYIDWIDAHVKSIHFEAGSSNSYNDAREVMHNLMARYKRELTLSDLQFIKDEIGGLLDSTEKDLERFHKFAKSGRAKAEVINLFKEDVIGYLMRIKFNMQN